MLFAQLDTITNNLAASSSSYATLNSEMKIMDPLHNELQTTIDDSLQGEGYETHKSSMNSTKVPLISKNESPGFGTSHFVCYKLQDGKHVKIWECGICK